VLFLKKNNSAAVCSHKVLDFQALIPNMPILAMLKTEAAPNWSGFYMLVTLSGVVLMV